MVLDDLSKYIWVIDMWDLDFSFIIEPISLLIDVVFRLTFYTSPSTQKSTPFSSAILSLHLSISTFRLLSVGSLAELSTASFNCFCSSSNLSYAIKGSEEANIFLF